VLTRRFQESGDIVILLGEGIGELGGSEYLVLAHGIVRRLPPAIDLNAERALQDLLVALAADRMIRSAHDCSDGGLAVALAECCLAGGHGAVVELPPDPFPVLFGESAARAVVAVRPGAEAEFAALCQDHGVPVTALGRTGGASLEVTGRFSIGIDELAAAHRGTLPALFG